MSILNDKEIRALSMVPTHFLDYGNKGRTSEPNSGLLTKFEDQFYWTYNGARCLDEMITHYQDQIRVIPDDFEYRKPMISPFLPNQVKVDEDGNRIVSYGTSSMGYDVRLDRQFKIFTNVYGDIIDPLNMPTTMYVEHEGDFVIIPPNSYVLGVTIETFDIPRDVLAICLGKSTYARCAGICNVTPIEPGFRGRVVIEVANLSTLPLKIYANQGIAQFLFLQGNPCEISYDDRGGKYQDQTGVQTALV